MTNPINPFSPFLPTTYDFPKEEDVISYFVTDNLARFADVINAKTIGAFTENSENFNGEKWIYTTPKKIRNGYQAIARIASFISQTISLPVIDVNSQWIISLVYGSASLPCSAVGAGDGRYFSFMPQGDARIQFVVTDTEIIITTNGTTAAYQGFIVVQYIRDGI